MHKEHHVKNAKAIVALLILALAFALFYIFATNQDFFTTDSVQTKNYVVFSIIGGGLLIGLLYLTSNTTHKVTAKKSSVKSTKKKRK
jgi:protein-S-isoprenylcysteine O-methyltransferase Ste14